VLTVAEKLIERQTEDPSQRFRVNKKISHECNEEDNNRCGWN
jgi:hypothetical protein